MTDDIVTRLRDIASLRGDMSGHVIPLACTEAADEIERLRKTIQLMSIDYRTQIAGLKMRCKCGANDAL